MRRLYTIMMFILAFITAFPSSSIAAKIVVDAGHGGSDPGAVGVNGLQEKTVNLDIARKLKELLVQRGYEVAMSRTDDRYISLKDRVDFTNGQKADLFVSIHANFYTDPNSRGAMVLYHDAAYPQTDYPASPEMTALSSQSKDFAQSVLDKFVQAIGSYNHGLIPSSVYVVRMGTIPSILVETAFLSNVKDAAMLANDGVRTQMSKAIQQGIEAYLPPDGKAAGPFADIGGHWAGESIVRLATQGIIDGVGTLFQPDRSLTRAEWATLLDRVFDLSKVQPAASAGLCASTTVTGGVYNGGAACTAPAAAFKDAPAGHWASATLREATAAGVLNGYEDGTLRPDQPVTRAEVAAMLQRLALPQAGSTAALTQQPFKDVPTDAWSAGAIASLKQAGWIDGMTADRFMPDRRMARGEAAALLDRYLQSRQSRK